jgi:hypothetical protein
MFVYLIEVERENYCGMLVQCQFKCTYLFNEIEADIFIGFVQRVGIGARAGRCHSCYGALESRIEEII